MRSTPPYSSNPSDCDDYLDEFDELTYYFQLQLDDFWYDEEERHELF